MGAGAIQVQFRRGITSLVSAFIGAPGETVVDLTTMRLSLHDGATVGGWTQEKAGLTLISDANYNILPTDTVVVFTKLTAARTLTLPSAMTYPLGQILTIVDGTGTSSAHTVTIAAATSTERVHATSTSVTLESTPSPSMFASLRLLSNGGAGGTANWCYTIF